MNKVLKKTLALISALSISLTSVSLGSFSGIAGAETVNTPPASIADGNDAENENGTSLPVNAESQLTFDKATPVPKSPATNINLVIDGGPVIKTDNTTKIYLDCNLNPDDKNVLKINFTLVGDADMDDYLYDITISGDKVVELSEDTKESLKDNYKSSGTIELVPGSKAGIANVHIAAKGALASRDIVINVLKPIEDIEIKCKGDVQTHSMIQYRTLQLETKVSPGGYTDIIEWSVRDQDKDIATIEDGLLTAKGYGSVVVTATAVNGALKAAEEDDDPDVLANSYGLNRRTVSYEYEVAITQSHPITELTPKKEYVAIKQGTILNLKSYLNVKVQDTGFDQNDRYIWASNNTKVATVDADGNVTASTTNTGIATISVRTDNPHYNAMTSVVIKVYTEASSITLENPSSATMVQGKDVTLIAKESPDGANEPLKWTAADDTIVRITPDEYDNSSNLQSAVFRGLEPGTTMVTVSTMRTENTGIPTEEVTYTFPVMVISDEDSTFLVQDIDDVVFNGTVQEIDPVVTDKQGNIINRIEQDANNKDVEMYTVEYEGDTVNAGVVTVTVTGVEEQNVYGVIKLQYRILPRTLSDEEDTALKFKTINDQTYRYGDEITPLGSGYITLNSIYLIEDKDYYLAYSDNVNAGTATVTVIGIGNFTGQRVLTFTINPAPVGNASVIGGNSFVYTADPIIPDYTLTVASAGFTLTEGVDYTVEYTNNVDVGTATATFTGIGNFKNNTSKSYRIEKKNVTNDIAGTVIIEDIPDQGYLGGIQVLPELTVSYNGHILTENTDYTLTYTNNTVTGTAGVKVDFSKAKNFTGILNTTFEIVRKSVTKPATSMMFLDEDGNELENNALTYIDKGESLVFWVSIAHETDCDDAIIPSVSESGNVTVKFVEALRNGKAAKFEVTGKTKGNCALQFGTLSSELNRTLRFSVLDPITSLKIYSGSTDITSGSDHSLDIAANHQAKLTARYQPASTTDEIEWSVDDESIATIAQDGTFTAKTHGTVIVTARVKDAQYGSQLFERTITATTSINIKKKNETTALSVSSGFESLSLEAGTTYNAENIIEQTIEDPLNTSTDKLVWQTSNSKVATVDSNGVIRALSKGSATITVTIDSTNADEVRTSFVVNVYTKAVSLTASAATKIIPVGNTIILSVTEAPDASEPIEWTVDNSGIISIEPLAPSGNVQSASVTALAAGTATVTVSTVRGGGQEEVQVTINITVTDDGTPPNIRVSGTLENKTYNGKSQQQEIVVTDTDDNVLDASNYTVTYSEDTTNVGTVIVTITGNESKGYYGTIELSYQILPAPVSGFSYKAIGDKTYSYGTPITPITAGFFTFNSKTLVADTDYTVDYIDNVNAGTAVAVITGIGNFTDELRLEFTIQPADISTVNVGGDTIFTYTGSEIEPTFSLTPRSYAEYLLAAGVDYDVSFVNNVEASNKAIAQFDGKGNFTGTRTQKFTIAKKNVGDSDGGTVVVADIGDQKYLGGMPVTPALSITYNGKTLEELVDYTVKYADHTALGTATVTIDFTKSANFTGVLAKTFEIVQENITHPAQSLKFIVDNSFEVNSNETIFVDKNKSVTVLVSIDDEDSDDVLRAAVDMASSQNAKAVVTAFSTDGKFMAVTVTGQKVGSYELTLVTLGGEANQTLHFTVLEPATKIQIYNGNTDITSTGLVTVANRKIQLTARLTPGTTTDRIAWYVSDTEKAEITQDGLFTAKANGSVFVTVVVLPSETSERGLKVSTSITISKANPITAMSFKDSEVTVNVGAEIDAAKLLTTSVLNPNNDTTDNLTWTSSDTSVAKVDAVTGLVKIQNKKGTAVITVTTDNLTPMTASFTINVETPVTSLVFSSDKYTFYTGDISYLTVSMLPQTASEELDFTIDDKSVAEVDNSEYDETTRSYTLTIKALKAGSCTITATTKRVGSDIDDTPDQVTATAGITVTDKIEMKGVTVTLAYTETKFTGKELKPGVTVKYKNTTLKAYTDYTVSYTDNINPGTAKVTIVGVGLYSGTINKEFTITYELATVNVKSVTSDSVALSWTKASLGNGYIVEKYAGGKWTQVTKIENISTITYTVTGLTPATEYKFRIKAYYQNGTTTVNSNSASVTATTKPVAIGSLKVSAQTATSATLAWESSPGATSYKLYQQISGKWNEIATTTTELKYKVSGLTAATEYKFKVIAYCGTVGSDESNTLSVLTNPAQVTGLTSSLQTDTSVSLKWAAVKGAASYKVMYYTGSAWKEKATCTSYVCNLTGLTPGTTYKFQVIAVDKNSNKGQASATLSVSTKPSQVTSVAASAQSATSVTLKWAAAKGADSYRIEQSINGTWTKLATQAALTYKVTGLKAATAYQFRITAINSKSKLEAAPSTTFSVTTNPGKVTGLNVSARSEASITLKWTAVQGASSYIVKTSADGGKTWKQLAKVSTVTYIVTGLKAGKSYKYKVIATDRNSKNGAASAVLTAYTLPAKVTGLKVSAQTATSVTLKWSAASGATSYKVMKYDGKWKTVKTVTAKTLKVTGLTAATAYRFKVISYNKNSKLEGAESATLNVTTNPGKVTGLTVSASTDTTLTLKWTAVKGASSYQVLQYKSSAWKSIATVSGTSYSIKGLKASTTYKYKVVAYDRNSKKGAASAVLNAVTNPSAVAGLKVSAQTTKTITLKWNKNTSATGYIIEIYKGGKWVKLKTTTNNTTLTYKATGLTAGTSYKFRVTSYLKKDKKTYYGKAIEITAITKK